MPTIGLALGFVSARLSGTDADTAELKVTILDTNASLTLGAVCLIALLILQSLVFKKLFQAVTPTLPARRPATTTQFIAHAAPALSLSLGFVAAIVLIGPQFAQSLGAVGIFLGFCLCVLLWMNWFSRIYYWYRFSPTLLLTGAALTFGVFGWNENHTVTYVPVHGQSNSELETLGLAFGRWLAARADLDDYKDQPYPVYIVSAEGGGAYAAQHASAVLARIQDSCPRFAQHLFAISGVSGGSLGAAVFASSTQKHAKNERDLKCDPSAPMDTTFQEISRKYFSHDLLSPVLAAALFPDFLQTFLPVGIGSFDRSRALEQSFSGAWRTVDSSTSDNPFTETLRGLWRPNGATPALVLNTTRVDTGSIEFVAPFAIEPWMMPQSGIFVGADSEAQTKLSTAVGLSARFPLLTPAGLVRYCAIDGCDEIQLVDGGYFENSGAETAHNIVRELQMLSVPVPVTGSTQTAPVLGGPRRIGPWIPSWERDPNILYGKLKDGRFVRVTFKLIIIRAERESKASERSLDAVVPLLALMDTRVERSTQSYRLATRSMCPHCLQGILSRTDSVHRHILKMADQDMELGWSLSPAIRARVWGSIGQHKDCRLSQNAFVSLGNIQDTNNCVYFAVGEGLRLRSDGGSSLNNPVKAP